jgi:hypothetical protein
MSRSEDALRILGDLVQESGAKIMWAVRSHMIDWSADAVGGKKPKVWGWYHGTNVSQKNLSARMCYMTETAAKRYIIPEFNDSYLVRVALVPLDPLIDPPEKKKNDNDA